MDRARTDVGSVLAAISIDVDSRDHMPNPLSGSVVTNLLATTRTAAGAAVVTTAGAVGRAASRKRRYTDREHQPTPPSGLLLPCIHR